MKSYVASTRSGKSRPKTSKQIGISSQGKGSKNQTQLLALEKSKMLQQMSKETASKPSFLNDANETLLTC